MPVLSGDKGVTEVGPLLAALLVQVDARFLSLHVCACQPLCRYLGSCAFHPHLSWA